MKRNTLDYLYITLGCLMSSLGFALFINPYKFVPGGVFGTSIVLHNLMPGIQVGTFGLVIGIPLLVLSYCLIGKGVGIKTLYATLITPLMMNTISSWLYPSKEALNALDPTQLLGGCINMSDNLMLAAIFGPVLVGVGESFIMNGHATSGGTDIIAMIIHKYFRVRFSNALMAVDAVVVLLGVAVIKQPILSCYSLISIFLMSRIFAYAVSGSKNKKIIFIVTESHNEALRRFILEDLDRTATVLDGSGLYLQQDKQTLMMVLRMREVDAVTTAIKQIDPSCFVIVTDAYDAYGTRWKPFPDKHSIDLS